MSESIIIESMTVRNLLAKLVDIYIKQQELQEQLHNQSKMLKELLLRTSLHEDPPQKLVSQRTRRTAKSR